MRSVANFVLLLSTIVAMIGSAAGCEADSVDTETADQTDSFIIEDDFYIEHGPCGPDDYCNNAPACGGGSPIDWSPNVDPDCGCDCNYYYGICEAKEEGSDEACECDYDCPPHVDSCDDDGHCDTWCPLGDEQSHIDPDCESCACAFYAHICEAGEECSTFPCLCDTDCEGGIFSPCNADGHCDSLCPTDEDPDCQDDENNGKYCY